MKERCKFAYISWNSTNVHNIFNQAKKEKYVCAVL